MKTLLLGIVLVLCIIGYSNALVRASCPAVRIKNGRAKYRQRGGFVQNSCNTGYMLAGDKYMKCSKGKWEGTLPVCVNDKCNAQRAPANGFVYPSHRGGVLDFFCKPSYELVGAATAFCDGKSWSTHLPICTLSNKTVSVSCDFESEDICGWTHDLNHNFDWTRHSRSTPSSFIGTGPFYDHTLGSTKYGHYMYIEASAKNPNDKARLISPVYASQENRTCLVFWYHMYGASMGELRVYLRLVSRVDWNFDSNDALWGRVGDHGSQWLRGFIDLDIIRDDFQVVFEGIRGGNYMSDTAIDDVSLVENCDLNDYDTITTTEETSTSSDDGRAYLESWSCYNRCGVPPGDTCSCLSDCYDQETCCPDYEAYCLDSSIDPTSSSSTELSTLFLTDEATTESTSEAMVATEIEQDGVEVPLKQPTILMTTTTTTLKPTTKRKQSPRILPTPKVKPLPLPLPTPARIQPISPTTSTPRTTTTLKTVKPVTLMKTMLPPMKKKITPQENEVLRNDKLSVAVAVEKDKGKKESTTMSTVIVIGVAILIVALLILTAVKMRRRVARACEVMRMRRGGSCDSQSDVRFLTSDEILDFSLASSTL